MPDLARGTELSSGQRLALGGSAISEAVGYP